MKNNVIQKKHSIKRTVFTAFSALTVLMFLFYSGLSLLISFVIEDKIINQLLVTEGNYLREEYNKSIHVKSGESINIKPRLYYMKVYASLADMPLELSRVINEDNKEKEIFTKSNQHFHYLTVVLSDGKSFYLIAEVSRLLVVSNMSGDILLFTFFILLITLAIALGLTYLISQRTIQPIIKLTNAVKLIKQSQGKTLLPYLKSKDEIGYLASTLETSFTQLNNALKREADFTRDVGHELRTPLTIINNTLALNEHRALSEVERIGLLQQSNNLTKTIDVLMALARAESIKGHSLNLRAHVEECILTMHSIFEEQNFSVILDINYNINVHANKQLLTLLLFNLLENSLRYATNSQLKISEKNSHIIFENEIFEPVNGSILKCSVKQNNSNGIGQGLYLVQRIVDSLHWQCSVESNGDVFKFILKID